MQDNSSKIRLLWQFFKFGLVGLSNTIISLAIYYFIIFLNRDLYMLGNVLGWVVSVANGFYWSNKYVFKSQENSCASVLKRLLRTYLSYGVTFLLSTALLVIQVDILGVSEWLAPVINLIITIPLNFIFNKFFAFKK